MKEDPPEIVKWEKKRSVRKSRPLHLASPKHLCVRVAAAGFVTLSFPIFIFFPSTWPTIPSRQFLLFSPGSQSCPCPVDLPCRRVTVFSRGWWWWPTVWRLWRCRRRTGWPAGWGAGSPPYWPTSRRAPLYDTPPAGGTHWPPGASRKNVLHLALVSWETARPFLSQLSGFSLSMAQNCRV